MEKKILFPGVKIIDIKWVVPYRGIGFFFQKLFVSVSINLRNHMRSMQQYGKYFVFPIYSKLLQLTMPNVTREHLKASNF